MVPQDSLLEFILREIESNQSARYADLFTLIHEYPEQIEDLGLLAQMLEGHDARAQFPLDEVRVYLRPFKNEVTLERYDFERAEGLSLSPLVQKARFPSVLALTQFFRSLFTS